MSDSNFQAGDVVTLKSGGPKMTTEKIGKFSVASTATDKTKCTWFEGTKKIDGVFELVTLQAS
jgi:uncharacterized protein YodC (DUF2158 family)